MVHVEPSGSGPRLVMIHGFTQSGQAWGPAAAALARHRTLLLLDAPGHGRSAQVAVDLPTGADLMAAAVAGTGGPAAWLGYSMGGRYALHVALRHPHLVERLILVSTTAGIDDPDEREARRRADDERAARLESEGVEPFIRWWLDQPLFATLPAGAAQMESRLEGSAAGLAASLRLAGTGTQEPLWDRLGQLAVPVLIVAGRLDRKYAELAERLGRAIGDNATVQILERAGHSCHLEQPDEFIEVVEAWLG
ncbi:MAG: alpha/beta fold hydrolase [Actinomycetota bacterium]|nr:alpha/beta fold hydrolase [Actinomycetota bacterium]